MQQVIGWAHIYLSVHPLSFPSFLEGKHQKETDGRTNPLSVVMPGWSRSQIRKCLLHNFSIQLLNRSGAFPHTSLWSTGGAQGAKHLRLQAPDISIGRPLSVVWGLMCLTAGNAWENKIDPNTVVEKPEIKMEGSLQYSGICIVPSILLGVQCWCADLELLHVLMLKTEDT